MNETNKMIAGRYRLKYSLGEGVFGYSYLVKDVFSFKNVVLKIARTSKSFYAMSIIKEAEILMRIKHPHIVRVYHSSTLEDGRPFIAVEWVDGKNLKDLISQDPFSLSEAISVLHAIAKALEALHSAGFIHRDIKPANVLIPQGRKGPLFSKAKLADFRVAGRVEATSMITEAGDFFGTPYYMAPEQVLGESQSTATDMYGLGVLLFEMIFHHPPFTGETPKDVLLKILTEEIKLPVNIDLPSRAKSLLLGLLSKDPNERPKNSLLVIKEIECLQRSPL